MTTQHKQWRFNSFYELITFPNIQTSSMALLNNSFCDWLDKPQLPTTVSKATSIQVFVFPKFLVDDSRLKRTFNLLMIFTASKSLIT